MSRLRITYSLSYDWLIQGKPPGDWRPLYQHGKAFEEAARAQWARCEDAVFEVFRSFGLEFWEAWPAFPVHLADDANAFKEPLTFPIRENWDDLRSVIIHELCHLHEDHPKNHERYESVLRHIRSAFPDEEEGVQYHLITCTLQCAVLRRVFPERWAAMIGLAKGHPILDRTWELIDARADQISWLDPLASLESLI